MSDSNNLPGNGRCCRLCKKRETKLQTLPEYKLPRASIKVGILIV